MDQLLEQITTSMSSGGMPAPAPAPSMSAGLDVSSLKDLSRLHAAEDAQQLHQAFIEAAISVTGGERSFLMLLEEGSKLRFKRGHNVDQAALTSPEFAGSRMSIKQVLQSGNLVAARNAGELQQLGVSHLRSLACVPVRYGQRSEGQVRTLGALYVDARSREFTTEQVQALDLVGQQGSVALENLVLRSRLAQAPVVDTSGDAEDLQRLQENIGKLYDVARSINSTLILSELLERIVDHVVGITRAQRGAILLLEGEELRYKVGRDNRKKSIPEDGFTYSRSNAQKAMDGKKALILKDADAGDLSMSMASLQLRSVMCVPLLEQGEAIGVVYVDSQTSNREFDDYDKEIVESICGQASVALTNAKLYQEAAGRERLAHELDIASKLQLDLLPKSIPQVTGLDMYGSLIAANEVGGDYFDFIPHEGTQDSVTVAIGDVSGKGVGAGMVMATARSILRSLVHHQGVPTSTLEIARSLNVMLCRDIPREMFMTFNVLLWDSSKRELRYTAAGHEHLLIYRAATQEVETIKAGGVAGGVLEQASAMMQEKVLSMAPGDHLVLYTDGVTEAMDLLHMPLGLEAVVDMIKEDGTKSSRELCERIMADVSEHTGAADPHDDVTIMALKAL